MQSKAPEYSIDYSVSQLPGSEFYWVLDGIHVTTLSENSEAAMNKMLDYLNQHSPKKNCHKEFWLAA